MDFCQAYGRLERCWICDRSFCCLRFTPSRNLCPTADNASQRHEVSHDDLTPEEPSKGGKKRRKPKAHDDYQLVEGSDEDKGKWPLKAHLRLMEMVKDDFINILLDKSVSVLR